jgi:hypothetical protein
MMHARPNPAGTVPHRKISEIFLDFAAPLLRTMPGDATDASLTRVLALASTVWNAMVLADVHGDRHHLDRLREAVQHAPGGLTLVIQLVERKRTLFGRDHSCIGAYTVTRQAGVIRLWAEARTVPP